MLEINEEHLRKFEEIKLKFFSKTKVPADNNWESNTDDATKSADMKEWMNKINILMSEIMKLSQRIGYHTIENDPIKKNMRFFGSYEGGIDFQNYPQLSTYSYKDDLSNFNPNRILPPIMVGATAGDQTSDKSRITFLQNCLD